MTAAVLLRDLVEGRSWMVDAACRPALGAPPNLWSADNVEARAVAMHVCLAHCPVVAECDAEASGLEGTVDRYRSMVVGGRFHADRPDRKRTEHPVATRCPLCPYGPEQWPEMYVQPKDRKPGRPGRQPAPCGTEAAYGRHIRHGEAVDDACWQARREAIRLRAEAKQREAAEAAGEVAA